MTITLKINGQDMSFSEKELVSIIAKHFEAAKGEMFKVCPKTIKRELFKDARNDKTQEDIRKLILEAFSECDKNPGKYSKDFYTMVPRKIWGHKSRLETQKFAAVVGGRMADWCEWALEIAQRIDNGETWEALCNEPDTTKWYRLITWKNHTTKFVGGSTQSGTKYSAADYISANYRPDNTLPYAVPLIIIG